VPTPPGSYVLTADNRYGVGLDITFTVPAAGWVSWGPGVVTNETDDRDHVAIGFADVINLFKDPCRWNSSGKLDPPVGPTVADLAAAFARLPHFTASAPSRVMVDGYEGTVLTLTIDPALDFKTCDLGEVHSWIEVHGNSRYHQGPGEVERFWIVDVRGTRLVINTAVFPDAPPANLANLAKIVESIKIGP
jgi:hypothetical protein